MIIYMYNADLKLVKHYLIKIIDREGFLSFNYPIILKLDKHL